MRGRASPQTAMFTLSIGRELALLSRLRLTFTDGHTQHISHVEWMRRLSHSDVEYMIVGQAPITARKVLKAEVFTDTRD